ncbi:MAG: hypothetical protein LBH27_02890 [Endomicrobium sp.]|jgi:hypothetical protein|nr:hypothetical protein [Endomicrobium sp.]
MFKLKKTLPIVIACLFTFVCAWLNAYIYETNVMSSRDDGLTVVTLIINAILAALLYITIKYISIKIAFKCAKNSVRTLNLAFTSLLFEVLICVIVWIIIFIFGYIYVR